MIFLNPFHADLVIRYNNSSTDLDQSAGSPEFWDDATYNFDQEEFFIRAQGKLNLMDDKWKQKFGLSSFRNTRNYSFDTSAGSIFYPEYVYIILGVTMMVGNTKLTGRMILIFKRIKLATLGTEFELEETSSEYYARNYIPSPIYPDETSIFPEKSANIFGIYLQDQLKIDESFFGTIGIRYDYQNQFGNSFTYRIAPAYIFWETGTKLKATIGTGFKAPSLFYLYDPVYGNSDLNPEQSFGWDAGIEQFFWSAKFSIGANYFYNKFSDMFGFDSNFKTINIKKAETNGVEVFAKADLFDGFNN